MATELPEDKIFICIYHFREEDIIRADLTVQADVFLGQLTVLTVSAVSYQYQVPLQFNHITDLQQIESLIDDILNFDCLGGNIIGEIDPTSTKKVFAMMISSLSKKRPQIVRIFPSISLLLRNFPNRQSKFVILKSVIYLLSTRYR